MFGDIALFLHLNVEPFPQKDFSWRPSLDSGSELPDHRWLMFAEIAIPLPVHQTFTYALPQSFAAQTQPGTRVLIPFGKQLVTGYVVAIHDSLEEAGVDAETTDIKSVEELFDTEPLVTAEMLELTKWIADYYFAPWGEVIKACLPAGINAEAETVLSITQSGRCALAAAQHRSQPLTTKMQALAWIAEDQTLDARVLVKQFNKVRAGAVIRELEKSGWITVQRQMHDAAVKPKLQQAVRLKDGWEQWATERRGDREKKGKRQKAKGKNEDSEPPAVSRQPEDGENKSQERMENSQFSSLHPPSAAHSQLPTVNCQMPLTIQQQSVMIALSKAAEPLSISELTEAANVSASVIKTLEKRGLVEVFTREVRRDPLAHLKNLRADDLILSSTQQAALEAITQKLDEAQYAAFLLHGVTGSGKTEVYIRAMRAAIEKGKTALMLVPEISLTPMFARRLAAHFGNAVAILHSSLSEGERLDEWNRLRRGEARVCIGARSAVFTPLENIGIIIVDEEHEAAYKQDESPRYHGRDTAIMRALRANAVVILGSATPSMESFHNAQTGKYQYIQMSERIAGRALARVEVVDMREVFARHGKQQVFSDEMKQAIQENFEQGKQTLVLLNRRGFSSFLVCRSCGYRASCPNCEVTLTYHKSESRLICHYCGHQQRVPKACSECNSNYIYYIGEGTEQIEHLLRDLYPQMRIARLDRDTTRKRGSFERLLGQFATGDLDLLVGTQMIAKGHDFHNVTLVCVISVDAGLSIPDFRSAERTFQLLTQVAGRAGRGELAGRVILQSYHPEHYALRYARNQVYEKFYEHEISFRQEMRYPPFVALINVLIHHTDYARAATAAAEFTRLLKMADIEQTLRISGPAPAPLSRIKNEHRLQVLIKTKNRRTAREALDIAMLGLKEAGYDPRMLNVEVDPVSLM
jgi:primosomal protein N' (replication factor Y)